MCGAHLVRDLRSVHEGDPDGQVWADAMANTLLEARDARPAKVQQRASGSCWRTLQGLIDFAVVQSYLSTVTKWGLDTLDALT